MRKGWRQSEGLKQSNRVKITGWIASVDWNSVVLFCGHEPFPHNAVIAHPSLW